MGRCKNFVKNSRTRVKKKKEGEDGEGLRILEVYGYAIGVIGLRVDDFLLMYVDEYEAVLKSHRETREQEYRDGWERMRTTLSSLLSSLLPST